MEEVWSFVLAFIWLIGIIFLQVVENVHLDVERFLSDCFHSLSADDASLPDYFSFCLDSIIKNLHELMQYFESHSQLQHLREQAQAFYNHFRSYNNCSEPVVSIDTT